MKLSLTATQKDLDYLEIKNCLKHFRFVFDSTSNTAGFFPYVAYVTVLLSCFFHCLQVMTPFAGDVDTFFSLSII